MKSFLSPYMSSLFFHNNKNSDSNITTDFVLVRLTNILDNMIFYPKKMLENLNITLD
jgi:hypothetical protein